MSSNGTVDFQCGNEAALQRSMRRVACGLMVMIGMGMVSIPASAYNCEAYGAQETFGLPTSVGVPRNKAYGTALSEWVQIGSPNYVYFCKTNNDKMGVGFHWYNQLTDSGTTYGDYKVWKTNVDGVGVAIRTRVAMSQTAPVVASGDWTDIGNPFASWSYSSSGQSPYSFGGWAEIALVKYGPVTGGKITSGNIFGMYVFGDGNSWFGNGVHDRKYALPEIAITTSSCVTPDVYVNLSEHSLTEFPTVGSYSTPVKFEMQINDCPAGMASVNYGFNVSSGTDYSASEGVVDLAPGSTAKWVRVKLMNADGTAAVKFDEWISLSDYNSSTGGSYKVGLSAAYVRTGEMTAGTANAELIIAMSYN